MNLTMPTTPHAIIRRYSPHMRVMLGLLAAASISVQASAKTILIMGDSISAGYGIPLQQGWVNQLQQRLNTSTVQSAKKNPLSAQTGQKKAVVSYRVSNASVSGETSSGGLARLPQLLTTYKPDVVVLELGGNDGLRGQPPQIMQQNLGQMIRLSQQANAKVLLLGMQIPPNYGSAYTQAFAQVYPRLAQQYRVPLVPFFLQHVAGKRELMQNDQIHPNAQAQKQLLDNAWPLLQTLLK